MVPSLSSLALTIGVLSLLELVTWDGSSALGQDGVPSVADLGRYAGPDRTERLIAGARREGTVAVYTSAAVEDMSILTAAFEKKYKRQGSALAQQLRKHRPTRCDGSARPAF